MTRREWIAGLAPLLSNAADNPLSGEALYRDVVRYVDFGEHRTAGEADHKTSEWLAAELKQVGFSVHLPEFTVAQFTPRETTLTIADRKVQVFPLWPVKPTGPQVLRADLARTNVDGKIAVVAIPFDTKGAVTRGSAVERNIIMAARAGAVAVLCVTEGPTGEIIAQNAEGGIAQWPVPAALIGQRELPLVERALRTGEAAALLMEGDEEPQAKAANVVGRLNRGGKWIVVSTPMSGWFRCGGERGPGVALWLGLARWAAQRKDANSLLFVASSGHELFGGGMKKFLEDEAPRPATVLCWAHLGAGIATYRWELSNGTPSPLKKIAAVDPKRYLWCSRALQPLLEKTFALEPGLKPSAGPMLGELAYIERKGYRTFGVTAGHTWHHTPGDDAGTTGPELLAPVAKALAESLEGVNLPTRP